MHADYGYGRDNLLGWHSFAQRHQGERRSGERSVPKILENPHLQHARRFARRAFQASVPLFLGGVDALVFHHTDSASITVFVAFLFFLCLGVATWLTFNIERYVVTVTATA